MEKIELTESGENPLNKESSFSTKSCSESANKQDNVSEKNNELVMVSSRTADEQDIEAEIKVTDVIPTNLNNDDKKSEAEESMVDDSVITAIGESDESNKTDPVPKSSGENLNEAVVLINTALCANYRSDSESDSTDSESDSTTSTTDSSSQDEADHVNFRNSKNGKTTVDNSCHTDLLSLDLPPIEDLKISLPENACVEIGVITSIVDTLVIVESYKGTSALDVDTVLFLECGKRPLGKVFEILGPVSEPVYAVRFNTEDQITNNNIVKGMKVYFAPQTDHTTFVFLSEVLKCRGSDASWKDNIEAPSEFQDFSDDEEENQFKKKNGVQSETRNFDGQQNSRKRTFSGQPSDKIIQPSRFKNGNLGRRNVSGGPSFVPRERFRCANPSNALATLPTRPVPPGFAHPRPNPFPYAPSNNPMNFSPIGSHVRAPPRFFGFPFPSFGTHQFRNYHPGIPSPFFTQRTHSYPRVYGAPWHLTSPPPPPPPQSEEQVPPEESSK